MTSTARRIALATAADHPAAGGGRKQCWECQRRRVVCDAVRPVCGKCKATGVVCPGYEDKKPLTWLAPGKVKTRTWKRKKPATKKESSKTTSEQDSSPESNKAVTRAGSQMVYIFPPSPGMELRSEVCDIIEATSYWNESVYPSFETTQLMKSPWIIPVRFIHYMPAATRHALVSMAIEHRMLRLSHKKTDPLMMEIRARFHHHRCLAIQALNEDVCNDATRGTDMTMASVMVFLYADLMGSATASNWRHHLNGYKSLVDIRGGFESVYRLTPYMAPMLLFPKIYDNIDLIAELYQSGYYPFLPCPVELFTDIIRINYLRYLIATDGLPEDMGTPQSASEDLIEDIIEFSPEAWAETREADVKEELLLMAQAYQSAIALDMAAFGFGVGDSLAGAELAYKLGKALSDSRGSSQSYRELMAELDVIHKVLLQVDQFRAADQLAKPTINALLFTVNAANESMKNFIEQNDPYHDCLKSGGSGNVIKDAFYKDTPERRVRIKATSTSSQSFILESLPLNLYQQSQALSSLRSG
ncbi:hypothetical protein K4K61_002002 [Colletotrichum sp. SAR11_59]|nr:hypothetical protein K4K61_002002 [Colletotrichum sp. SAR11_59]